MSQPALGNFACCAGFCVFRLCADPLSGQYPSVRIPLPLAILLVIVIPIGSWWLGTRKMDFLSPPSDAHLAGIRQKTAADLSRPAIQPPKLSPRILPAVATIPSPEKKPEPTIDIGDLNPNPGLNTYAELAPKGARHLIELASLLETAGESPRALLVWERVLDSTTPDPPQIAAALAAIKRLRSVIPMWQRKPAGAIPIVIHANTSTKLEKSLKSILEQAAHDLQRVSSGILKVSSQVTTKRKSLPKNSPSTVDLWLSGAAEKSPVTATISFSVTKTATLQADTLRKLFRCISKRLEQNHAFTRITPAATNETTLEDLGWRITRLRWQELALSLNAPQPAAPEKIPPPPR
jgi:hypothetical protein